MARKEEELNSDTPQWFRDWHNHYFREVKTLAKRNEKFIFVILASILVLNTVGNYYHEEIMAFVMRLFGG